MSFSGFSEEDIKKLQNGAIVNNLKSTNINVGVSTKLGKSIKTKTLKKENEDQKDKIIETSTTKEHVEDIESSKTNEMYEEKNTDLNANIEKNTPATSSFSETETKNIKIGSTEFISTKIDFEEFQAKQKFIEEQNKLRKELLARALADRTKRTQEEAERLQEIQVEFKKLDDLLSTDVKVLRKKIEIASIHFCEAEKKFYKIEKEFMEAKLLMQKKLEAKEMLTEHLCTIIEKNEERKADKLTELLKKLEMTTSDKQ